jgi:plastocyanin
VRLRTRSLTPFLLLSLAAAAHGADVPVTVSNFVFSPATVTINEGDSVTWTNTGGFHNVSSDTPGLFRSGDPAPAPWTYSHTFATAGTFPYYCEIHGAVGGAGMSGVVTVVPLPTLAIADRAVVEGNTGTTNASFTVTLSVPSASTVTVMFHTADGTALAGSDYTAVSPTILTFAPGTTIQTATVSVTGDTVSEDNETFFVRLTSPTNATIADNEAVGTILDDDDADFFPLSPCRVVDTRLTPGPGGGPALPANSTRVFPITGLCGVPADARAIALNVTTVNAGDLGDLRLYPADAVLPNASTLNFGAGKTRANNALIVLGTGGKIAVRNDMPPGSTATTDVVIDVSGYFKQASGAAPGPVITLVTPTSVAKGSPLLVGSTAGSWSPSRTGPAPP